VSYKYQGTDKVQTSLKSVLLALISSIDNTIN